MVQAFLRDLANRGVERVKLVVVADNEAARALYARQGWQEDATYRTSDGRLVYRLVCETALAGSHSVG